MRNSINITRKYQTWYMIGKTAIAVFACILLIFVVFLNFFGSDILRIVAGCIVMLVYCGVIYSAAATLGKLDAKPYTPLDVQLWRPLVWSGIIAGINILFLIIYKINWAMMPESAELPTVVSIVINALFYLWNAPFMAFIYGNQGGYISPAVIILMITLPIAFATTGYYAGSKNIYIIDKIRGFMFEKSDSEE